MKKLLCCLVLLTAASSCKKYEANNAVALEDEGATVAAVHSDKMMISLPQKDQKKTIAIETKIIREGDLRFETDNLESTYARIAASVKKHGALIQSDSQAKDYNAMQREMSVRVPSQHFDAFVSEIGKGVGYFDRKEISSRDVTEEFIDTEARLKNKKILEARYLDLLKKAAKVSEILEIEKQLSEVREAIESKEGQLKYLQSRVSMSVVNIAFYKTVATQGGVTISYGSKMWNAIVGGFFGISSFLLTLLYIWPIILILVALIFVLRKRFRRKKTL